MGLRKRAVGDPAFAHHTDFAAIIRQGRIEGEEDGFRASTHYDLALPKIDWDAQWKVSTERAYLSSDPTHPIYLGNNRRFDIDRPGTIWAQNLRKRGERNAAVLRMLLRLIKS
mgnify:CR=1 FL=1